ncbi:MAG: metallophosphoesterase [Pseudomonadota bacterium]|nr:metallophosphoesterase [Pseudomonadota bacterium]
MADTLTLFHLSDIHFGLEDRVALGAVSAAITRQQPAAVLITGDLTMRARRHEFAAARDWIGALKVPVTVEVGNHDMPYFNLFERFADPYRRFLEVQRLLEKQLTLPGISVVPLLTSVKAQWRWPWSEGRVSGRALAETLAAIDRVPKGSRVLVTAHHPLIERGPRGQLLTIGGTAAMAELAKRGVAAVLSGHVHDPFDLIAETANGPLRMIGAGTLSKRIRSTPASYNEITVTADAITVRVCNSAEVPTDQMQLDAVPKNALPPRQPGEPVAPIGAVPAVDPPTH